MGKTRDLFKKIRDAKGTFHAKMGSIKDRSYKEQYCIGTWNVRSMNQGKLELVKQEMARVNVKILG